MDWTKRLAAYLGICSISVLVTSFLCLEEGKGQAGQSQRPSTPVEVVNTPLAVNLSNTPVAVNVANWVPVEPYKKTVVINVPHSAGSFTGVDGTLFIPSGKRLVIEHISASASNVQGGKVTELRICTRSGTNAGGLDWHYLTLSSPVLTVQHLGDGSDFPIEYLTCSQPIRIYADGVSYPSNEYGGAQLIVKGVVFADSSTAYTGIQVTISGFLVAIP